MSGNLIIDSGNTRIKTAVFENDTLLTKKVFASEDKSGLKAFAEGLAPVAMIIADVTGGLTWNTSIPTVSMSAGLNLPFQNRYGTPESLGHDRIAAVAGLSVVAPGKNTLVIDAGTCIKYDFLSSEGIYSGGSISPGLEMRYKALQAYTGKLPFITRDEREKWMSSNPSSYTGNDTASSLITGVEMAVRLEIEGFINVYGKKSPGLRTIFTGGDGYALSEWFDLEFDEDLVLKGLNRILLLNLPRL